MKTVLKYEPGTLHVCMDLYAENDMEAIAMKAFHDQEGGWDDTTTFIYREPQ